MAKTRGLYQRTGSPFWFMRYADENGKIVRTSTGTTEKKLAASILGKKRTAVVENRHLDIKRLPNVSFHELCDEYWNLHGKNLKARGLTYYMESLKTEIGDGPLREITQKQIERVLSDWMSREEFSVGTRNTYLMRLKSIFNKAVEWGYLSESPAAGVKNLRGQEGRTRFLTTPEIAALLAAASKRLRPLLLVALHTGMRQGEIFRLRWSDIDFENRLINIHGKTKSGKNRSIPMDDTLFETLQNMKKTSALVFPSRSTGHELTSISRIFPRLLKKAKIENFRFHDLRHTFASHLVMNGVDLAVVRDLLGHSTVRMTERYAHLAPGYQVKAVKTLDTAFGSSTITSTVPKSYEQVAGI